MIEKEAEIKKINVTFLFSDMNLYLRKSERMNFGATTSTVYP